MKKLYAVVMAAGLGTRMKSATAKVLHPILGRPMLAYPLEALKALRPARVAVVVGHQADRVREAFAGHPELRFALQEKQRGTADAFRSGLNALGRPTGTILVVSGDMPLLSPAGLKRFLATHRRRRAQLTVGTFVTDEPGAYGRILKDARQAVTGIVEYKDATADERAIREVNGGVYAIEPVALPLLGRIRRANKAGEYYLTDLVGLAVGAGLRVRAGELSEEDLMGVNSRVQLERASRVLRRRIAEAYMNAGVTIMDPDGAFIAPGTRIGSDTTIYPGVHIEGRCRIGSGCTLFPGVRLVDSVLADRVTIRDSSLIENSTIGADCSVGPLAHLRPGNVLKPKVRIGNFVELKKARLGEGTKAGHLSYIGDAVVGRDVNVGAGTITCNYDGRNKHQTRIGDDVFIGSDTQMVAPVRVGKGAYIGAGSTVVSDVPAGSLAVSRSRQRNIEGWVKARGKGQGARDKGKERRK